MKISIINQPMDLLVPPHQNSIGLWTYHVAPHVARSHEVTVYGPRLDGQREWHGSKNVEYRFKPCVLPSRKIGKLLSPIRSAKLPAYASRLYYLDYILQVAREVRAQRADVAHIHNFTQFVPIVRRLNPDIKITLHMNCEWLTQLDYDVMDRRLRATDAVFGCSDYITGKVQQRFPHHADRCKTVYNGVDAEAFSGEPRPLHDGDKRLLFVGRVSPEKGVHDLIEAFVKVVEQHPKVILDIVGPIVSLPRQFIVGVSDDPEVAQLASLYDRDYGDYLRSLVPPHLAERVNFVGGLPQAELLQFYQKADVLVNPSYSESFGMSLVEAMAIGRPVVATRAGGMVEIIEGSNAGLLVERRDPAALSAAILELLNDDERRASMGRAGHRRVLERFEWSRVAESLAARYREIDGGHG